MLSSPTARPSVTPAPRPKGVNRARRNRRWLEMYEQLGCTYGEIAALTGHSIRAVKYGVADARVPTNAALLTEADLFDEADLAEFSATAEGRAWVEKRNRRPV